VKKEKHNDNKEDNCGTGKNPHISP